MHRKGMCKYKPSLLRISSACGPCLCVHIYTQTQKTHIFKYLLHPYCSNDCDYLSNYPTHSSTNQPLSMFMNFMGQECRVRWRHLSLPWWLEPQLEDPQARGAGTIQIVTHSNPWQLSVAEAETFVGHEVQCPFIASPCSQGSPWPQHKGWTLGWALADRKPDRSNVILWPNSESTRPFFCHILFIKAFTQAHPVSRERKIDLASW